MRQRLGHRPDRSCGNTACCQFLNPFIGGGSGKGHLQFSGQGRSIGQSVFSVGKAWILRQRRIVDDLAKCLELFLFVGGNIHHTVSGFERARRASREIIVAVRDGCFPSNQMV